MGTRQDGRFFSSNGGQEKRLESSMRLNHSRGAAGLALKGKAILFEQQTGVWWGSHQLILGKGFGAAWAAAGLG